MTRYDEQYFGIKVTLPDGSYDWYDPCEEEPITNELGVTTIHTRAYEFEILVPITWEKYPLCSECGYEVDKDSWCKVGCPLCAEE